MVYSTDHSKAVVPVLVLLLCGLFYGAICFMSYLVLVLVFFFFSVLLALRLPHLGKRELILVLFVRLFDFLFIGLIIGFIVRWLIFRMFVLFVCFIIIIIIILDTSNLVQIVTLLS